MGRRKRWVDDESVPKIGHIKLHQLGPQHVQRMLREKSDEGLSPRTVHRIRAVLRTALTQAEKWSLVLRNVAKLVEVPRAARFQPRVFSPDEAKAFIAAANDNRMGTFFTVAMAVGLRLGEALGLQWADIDLERKTLRVQRALQRVPAHTPANPGGKKPKKTMLILTEPKSEKSRRTVVLPDFAVAALKQHHVEQKKERLKAGSAWRETGMVFTTTIGTFADERNVRREFALILRAAELPHTRIHDLRHTAASLLLAQGTHPRLVQEMLGHSQISLTLDTYSHLIPGMQQQVAHQMDAIITAATPLGSALGSNSPN